jgi:hypothetical protein
MPTYQITKVKAGRWAGHYVPACYRVDQLNDLGHHTKRLGLFDSLAEAEAYVASIKGKK